MCNYYTCCVNLYTFCVNFTNILRKFLHTLCNLYIRTTQIYIHTLRKNVHTLCNCTATVCECLHLQFVKFYIGCVVFAHIVCNFYQWCESFTHTDAVWNFLHTQHYTVLSQNCKLCDLHIFSVYNICRRKCGWEFFGQISCLYSSVFRNG